ncbi:MAG: zf-HC2 domain-containing protein [Lachnospiraceae bacterium]|jgi:hypothetical protein|nr:zf-HC2 domain-containing protein [Lachnospiraceae bacterium]
MTDCKDIMKLIPRYQAETLSTRELKAFLAHIDECKECQEELAIHYLINEGIMRLEDGAAFDLPQIMEAHRARATTQLKRRSAMQMLVYVFEVLIVLAVITVLLLVFLIGA